MPCALEGAFLTPGPLERSLLSMILKWTGILFLLRRVLHFRKHIARWWLFGDRIKGGHEFRQGEFQAAVVTQARGDELPQQDTWWGGGVGRGLHGTEPRLSLSLLVYSLESSLQFKKHADVHDLS